MQTFSDMSLSLHNVSFLRHYHLLFKNVTCDVHSGEILEVRGANGSGKSTLLRLIAGFLEPEDGDILWQQTSIFKQRDEYQQHIHYLGHQNGLKPQLTLLENIQLFAALMATPIASREIESALQTLGLQSLQHKIAGQLSAGQQRRAALTRLLLNRRPVWILDEPMTSLDAEGQAILLKLIEQHANVGGITLWATHQEYPLKAIRKHLTLGRSHANL